MIRLENVLIFVQVLQDRIRSNLKSFVQVKFDVKKIGALLIPDYYKEMFIWFNEIKGVIKEPHDGNEVRRQLMWHNLAIQVQQKSLFNKSLWSRGVNLIDDFVDDSGSIIGFNAFAQRYPFACVNRLTYMGWCQAIPPQWKRKLANSEALTMIEREQEPKILVKDKEIPLSLLKASYFNALSVPKVIPTAQRRWEAENVMFGEKWSRVYLLPFKVTTSTRLQSLQFKIIHRFFPTRRYLCTRKVVEDPFCNNCGNIESLEHCFYECNEVAAFWSALERALNVKLPMREKVKLTCHDVMFGCLGRPDVINLIILVAKQFIVSQRIREGLFNMDQFRPALLKMFRMEKRNALANVKMDRFRERWTHFIDIAGALDIGG